MMGSLVQSKYVCYCFLVNFLSDRPTSLRINDTLGNRTAMHLIGAAFQYDTAESYILYTRVVRIYIYMYRHDLTYDTTRVQF